MAGLGAVLKLFNELFKRNRHSRKFAGKAMTRNMNEPQHSPGLNSHLLDGLNSPVMKDNTTSDIYQVARHALAPRNHSPQGENHVESNALTNKLLKHVRRMLAASFTHSRRCLILRDRAPPSQPLTIREA